MKQFNFSEQEIKNAILVSTSFRSLAKNLGTHATKNFNNYIKSLKLDLSHFTISFPGNSKYKSKIGHTFGYLKINDIFLKKESLKSNYYAKCTCKCGKDIEILMSNIARGSTRSCGCIKKDIVKLGNNNPNWTGIGDISGTLFKNLKNSAKNRYLEFNITKEYLWELFLIQNKKCAISGINLTFGSVDIKESKTASLDRIDNNKGYIKDNVQWVHKDVNMMKYTHTLFDFIQICKTITENQFNVKIYTGRCDKN